MFMIIVIFSNIQMEHTKGAQNIKYTQIQEKAVHEAIFTGIYSNPVYGAYSILPQISPPWRPPSYSVLPEAVGSGAPVLGSSASAPDHVCILGLGNHSLCR